MRLPRFRVIIDMAMAIVWVGSLIQFMAYGLMGDFRAFPVIALVSFVMLCLGAFIDSMRSS